MNFFEKSLTTIELPEILNLLAAEAVSDSARELAFALVPSTSLTEVEKRIQETSAAKEMMVIKGSPTFFAFSDVRPSVSRADLGGTLNTKELIEVSNLLRCARVVKSYVNDKNLSTSAIDYIFHALRPDKGLEEKISSSIVGVDEIADAASAELASIRRKMRAVSSGIRESLQKIISSPSYAKVLQETIITTRAGRYVVPVKAEFKGSVPGLVHDISASGMTLFIEPMSAVKANNELRELAAKEKNEIERILAELSADCANCADAITEDYALLSRLDFIFAKARLSYKLNCAAAEISDREVFLRKARHPLLDQSKAVPISISLGDNFDTLVITGPNTGGKTVTLKTMGLLSAMNQCGLHIPAEDGCRLPVFNKILADIGDEQSIEQNLSTFSSHMSNIVSIIDECDEKSLVLFDELGAGTDPTEGAALAISIIEHIRNTGALVAATTHYSELKIYATNEKHVQNASCEFDIETLRPTYRLLVGIPGKSNAFAISSRLGLMDYIIEDAKGRVATESSNFEATIEKLEETRTALERERDEVNRQLVKAKNEAKEASRMRAELQVRLEKADVKARRDAELIIAQARETAESVFEELDTMRKRLDEAEDAAKVNEARNELRRRLNQSEKDLKPVVVNAPDEISPREIFVGDMVKVKSIGITAEVLEKGKDNTLVLKAGMMSLTAKENEVLLVETPKIKEKRKLSAGNAVLHSATIETRIDLRGMESIEAVIAAEQYIDNAVMAKLKTVTILHGKGTGALRTAVQQMLKKNKFVKSFRNGVYGEGENGVTIVELK